MGLHLSGLRLGREYRLKAISRHSGQQHLDAMSPFKHRDSVDQHLSHALGQMGKLSSGKKKCTILIGWSPVPCPQAEACSSLLPWPC